MLIVEDRTIMIHRGDSGTLNYEIYIDDDELYSFQVGDEVELRVFEKNGYNKIPVLSKKIVVKEECTSVKIKLESVDTLFGESNNKPTIYWYDIYLNGNVTNGYDEEEKASLFKILPAKGVVA